MSDSLAGVWTSKSFDMNGMASFTYTRQIDRDAGASSKLKRSASNSESQLQLRQRILAVGSEAAYLHHVEAVFVARNHGQQRTLLACEFLHARASAACNILWLTQILTCPVRFMPACAMSFECVHNGIRVCCFRAAPTSVDALCCMPALLSQCPISIDQCNCNCLMT